MRTLSRFKRQQINGHIRAGGLIAYPTEAVFGLGCDPDNQAAVYSLLTLKKRSPSKGLILIASNLQQLTPYVEPFSPETTAKLQNTWPGPITWLLPARSITPNWLTGTHTTLACRVTTHPVVRQICQAFNGALVSTSANLAGHPPCRTGIQVRKQFSNSSRIVIVPGKVDGLKKPTPILNALTDLRLR